MQHWQQDRDKTKGFFEQKQRGGLSLDTSPWVTLAVGKELLQLVIEGVIHEGMSAMDVGCSVGVEAMYLSKQGLSVTGVDFVPDTIERAKTLANLVGAPVQFLCQDFLELDIEPVRGSFDLVLDQGCFHHMPLHERSLYAKKVFELLADNGLFFLRAFSDHMLPSPTHDGPIRLSADAILDTFQPLFAIERLYRFQNIPLPNSNKPQIFWAFLGRKRSKT
jgi:2-polyprenyl-3-methyl-5-hydroxy-6-metoxy-1,4-benzoquinol methylase